MTLHLIYRIYGGENLKGRPPYYSKRTCLASFLQAAENAGADVVMLADGPIPSELTAALAGRGEVVQLPGGPVGMRRSYVAGLKFPQAREWPDEDIVYFCEDDYLHDPEAFVELARAAREIPSAAYFALYGGTPLHPVSGPGVPLGVPKDWVQVPDVQVGERRWVNVPSTASTFGARVGRLRTDIGIFRQGMIPYRTRYLDHEISVVYQGRFPYSAAELFLGPPATRFRSGLKELAANIVLTPFRIAYQCRALTRRRSPHLLYASDPNLACHLESEFLAGGTDWSEIASVNDKWAETVGLPTNGRA